MADLQGRVAVVTGGGTGIGKGIARRLAAEGCRLVVSASNSFAGAEELRDELRANGAEIEITQADFRDPDTARGVVTGAIDRYGQLDILVNNAGWTLSEEFLEGATQNWLDIFNINLIAMITGSQEAARHMVERGSGRIINISSVHGYVHIVHNVVYASTKGGINGFTRALALALAPHGVTCNVIAPGASRSAAMPTRIWTPPPSAPPSRPVASASHRNRRSRRLPRLRRGLLRQRNDPLRRRRPHHPHGHRPLVQKESAHGLEQGSDG